ncbi:MULTISPECIES: M3 family oligoendopeptidase [Methylobacterium]|jgi:oligoendopeptidase F|uniref:M3 family oligoendopeptidase n=1 Tax=Methylobacterium TaxID=407 RepID=UPI0008ECA1D6|nr:MULTISPECIES: M3 family oligoendopeptidase [Methylobacterium]MBZ6416088.1 M3 family oligoendopeptidase [Methylobacterium sp.]MBK3400101.1 M3 family oligoendopeptidase [Methylobacterium ajmalii]MBK3408988.1 M3 family oligoendopeptidase [Methylobacterium ajmalii]MBK3422573.1 M3 family oligoendopeptidase [Methylobacterium ajmalii]SFF58379.1 oligoendopeptidase F [Methylobacterium sp. yr596]
MPQSAAAPSDSALSTAQATARAVDLGPLPEWDLSDLYAGLDDPAFAADLAQAEAECRTFAESYRGRVADLVAGDGAADRLGTAVAAYEAIEDRLGRLMSYAGLVYSGDTTDPARAKFYGDTQERLTAAASDLLFFTLELNRIEDRLVDAAAAHPPLSRYRPWLEDIRREKPHQLSDEAEKLFLEKSVTGRAAWNRLFDETIASLRFPLRGEELTLEPTLNKLQDPDETVRRDAAGALSSVFRTNLRVFTLITNTLAKDKEISDRWRGFTDVSDARHLANRVERDTVEALVAAVQAAYPRLSHRYYKLKARWFGRDSLAYWDRNAPLPKVEQRTIPWAEARETVLSAYGAFSPKMAEIARRFFDGGWIDAPVRPGKAPGAFAHPTVPSAHPFVLVNYQGKPRDVMTLAHELGHGVHQVLAGHNGALMAPTPLTLAETASVFGEMLTFRRVLEATTDPVQRRAMLAAKVEDMINTVVRQIAFYAFERKVHLARREGELTAEKICELWMSVQAESLGPAIRLDEGYEPYWAYIPHFIHSPFYVYAYAFGDCLVNSLYGVYQGANGAPAAEEAFVERYFALLAAGGSRPYGELLAPFGLDARDPAFWQIGLSMIEGMIAELEAMEV